MDGRCRRVRSGRGSGLELDYTTSRGYRYRARQGRPEPRHLSVRGREGEGWAERALRRPRVCVSRQNESTPAPQCFTWNKARLTPLRSIRTVWRHQPATASWPSGEGRARCCTGLLAAGERPRCCVDTPRILGRLRSAEFSDRCSAGRRRPLERPSGGDGRPGGSPREDRREDSVNPLGARVRSSRVESRPFVAGRSGGA